MIRKYSKLNILYIPKRYNSFNIPTTIHSAELTRFKDNSSFQISERPLAFKDGIPKNTLLIKMITSSINPLDGMVKDGKLWRIYRRNHKTAFPIVMGMDGYGEVIATGNGVLRHKPGDKVVVSKFSFPKGTFSTFIIAKTPEVAPAPKKSPDICGAFPYVVSCANVALKAVKSAGSSSKILVVGGGGSVGSALIQLLSLKNLKADAICGKTDLDYCKKIGAINVYDYSEKNVFDKIKSDCNGYDYVIDASKYKSVDCKNYFPLIRPNGKFLTYNNDIFDTISQSGVICGSFKSLFSFIARYVNVYFGHRVVVGNLLFRPMAEELAKASLLVEQNKLAIRTAKTFPMKDMGAAFHFFESKDCRGKVVIRNQEI